MPGIVVENHPGMTTFGIKFNVQKPPMEDVNLRKAVAHAFDYEAFLKIYNGNAKLQTSPFPFAIKGHIDVPGFPRQDLDKAREYLAKSKHPDGGIELEYVYVQGLEEERKMGLVLIDNLKPLNISINMVPLTWPNMTARGAKVESSPRHDGDLRHARGDGSRRGGLPVSQGELGQVLRDQLLQQRRGLVPGREGPPGR